MLTRRVAIIHGTRSAVGRLELAVRSMCVPVLYREAHVHCRIPFTLVIIASSSAGVWFMCQQKLDCRLPGVMGPVELGTICVARAKIRSTCISLFRC